MHLDRFWWEEVYTLIHLPVAPLPSCPVAVEPCRHSSVTTPVVAPLPYYRRSAPPRVLHGRPRVPLCGFATAATAGRVQADLRQPPCLPVVAHR
jgi:hypothetical protein